MTTALDNARLETILDAISDRLPGDWLVLGGALVSVWLDARRTTEDVDVIGLGGTLAERYALLRLAGDLGLAPETLNSASDFFLEQIPGWRDELEVWKRGAVGTIWRPSPTLLVMLKSGRLSTQDLADCAAAIDRAREEQLPLDVARLLGWIAALPPTDDAALAERRERLARLVEQQATG